MRRAAFYPFLGPAVVLYLLADVSASSRAIDTWGYLSAVLALLLSGALVSAAAGSDQAGMSRVGWLGFATSLAILPLVSRGPLDFVVEESSFLGLSLAAALVLDLALHVPDSIVPARYQALARSAPWAMGVLSAALSSVALGPSFSVLGLTGLLPANYVRLPVVLCGLSVLVAFALRLARRRLGSTPDALASNAWAVLGLLPAMATVLLAAPALLLPMAVPDFASRELGVLSALAIYLGHLWLVDPRRKLLAGPMIRELAAAAVSGVALAAIVVPLRRLLPASASAFALWVAATLLLGIVLLHVARPLVHRALSPFRGRLLDELQAVPRVAGAVDGLLGLARVELAGMRRASGASGAQPLLHAFDPAVEVRIDAAGEVHRSDRSLHPAILERLRATPGEIILRMPLESQIVRQPKLRTLVQALTELDVLCIVPLVNDGELEGALCIPMGARRAALSLEELEALREHAAWLASLLGIFCAQGRTQARSEALVIAHQRAETSVERLEDELARARSELEMLHAGGAARAQSGDVIAYSPTMRALLDRLRALAGHDVPILLQAERGLRTASLARFVHVESGRGAEPFITLDCAALRADQSAALLCGGQVDHVRHAGALRVAGAGTVFLSGVPALARDAQRALAAALASRSVRTVDGTETYALEARVIVSSQTDLALLGAAGSDADAAGFDGELASRLSSAALRVPPLRERREDVSSAALLAIDRVCRRLGRPVLGFEPDALDALRGHDFPGNDAELERLVESAVAVAVGERIRLQDLSLADGAVSTQPDPLDCTLEEVERRALMHALARSLGNKSEAARLLGLPRTTFLDKLRRHKLDDGTRDSQLPPPN